MAAMFRSSIFLPIAVLLAASAVQADLPLHFEPVANETAFVSRLPGHSVRVDADGLSVQAGSAGQVHLTWASDHAGPLAGDRKRSSQSHYLLAGQQRRHVPHFGEVRQEDAFPGIDLRYYGNHGRLEFDFVLSPGADPETIAIDVQGAAPYLDETTGDLILETPNGELRSLAPVVYQRTAGVNKRVEGRYRLDEDGLLRFALAEYDEAVELVIDPILEYATYLTGDDDDGVFGIATGPDGTAFMTGFAEFAEDGPSAQFPTTPGAFDTTPFGEAGSDEVEYDAFVLKLNEDGTDLVWSTFLGAGDEDVGRDVAVGPDGAPVVVGWTRSQLFPTTAGAFDRSRGGALDGFAAKLSADGSDLLWSTFLGGSGADAAYAVELTSAGMPVVVGTAGSDDFPTVAGAHQMTRAGDDDAFILRLSTDGMTLLSSTYLGGVGDDTARGVAIDGENAIYVAGGTESDNFPTTEGVFQTTRAGDNDSDAFVAKLPPALDSLSYATYFGGNGDDRANDVVVAPNGTAHFAGYTESDDFPIGGGAFDDEYNGSGDAFFATLDPAGASAECSYLGGSDRDEALALARGPGGHRYIVGQTQSADFPVGVQATQSTRLSPSGDGFISQFSADGAFLDGTYYGSSNEDSVEAVAWASNGAVFVGGTSQSEPRPRRPLRTTPGAFETGPNDDPDAFAAKFTFPAAGTPVFSTVSAAGFVADQPVAPASLVSGFGPELAGELASATSVPLPTELAGVRVLIVDSADMEFAAELIFVSSGQINYVIPDGVALGPAVVRVERDGEVVAEGAFVIAQASPNLFSANANGAGPAAASVVQAPEGGAQQTFFAFTADAPGARDALPIDLGPEGTVTVLVVFGSGFRNASEVTATLGGQPLTVLFAGEQPEFRGLDQANLLLDRSLIGLGSANLVLVADGVEANVVVIAIQ